MMGHLILMHKTKLTKSQKKKNKGGKLKRNLHDFPSLNDLADLRKSSAASS